MTREEAKRRAELYSALAEGKIIQFKQENGEWTDLKTDLMCGIAGSFRYRIKPELKYRPFKTKEECLQEMLKHQPFGVVKDKHFANYQTHRAFTFLTNEGCNFRGYEDMTFETSFKNLLFADGTPFGVKVEE